MDDTENIHEPWAEGVEVAELRDVDFGRRTTNLSAYDPSGELCGLLRGLSEEWNLTRSGCGDRAVRIALAAYFDALNDDYLSRNDYRFVRLLPPERWVEESFSPIEITPINAEKKSPNVGTTRRVKEIFQNVFDITPHETQSTFLRECLRFCFANVSVRWGPNEVARLLNNQYDNQPVETSDDMGFITESPHNLNRLSPEDTTTDSVTVRSDISEQRAKILRQPLHITALFHSDLRVGLVQWAMEKYAADETDEVLSKAMIAEQSGVTRQSLLNHFDVLHQYGIIAEHPENSERYTISENSASLEKLIKLNEFLFREYTD